jgi:hypothetical protein
LEPKGSTSPYPRLSHKKMMKFGGCNLTGFIVLTTGVLQVTISDKTRTLKNRQAHASINIGLTIPISRLISLIDSFTRKTCI